MKRIALINDVTGYSRCSIAAQLPIISAMGIECVFVPTAILSVNTMHPEYYFDDYTDRMNDYIETYKRLVLMELLQDFLVQKDKSILSLIL